MTTAVQPRSSSAAEVRHGRRVLAAMVLSGLSFTMLQIMVVPLLGRLSATLHVSASAAGFLLTGQLLAAAVATPLLGRVGDVRGRRTVLLVALGCLLVGCVVTAASRDYAVVLAGRLLQGAGGAVFPLATAILADAFPAGKARGAIATFSVTIGVGGGLGLVVAGVVAAHTEGFAAVFWLGAVLSGGAFVAVLLLVPDTRVAARERIDAPGALLLSGWLVCLLVPLSEGNGWGWGSPRTVGLFLAAAVLLLAWVAVEVRVDAPLVDMTVFGERAVLTTNLSAVLVGFALFGSFIVSLGLVQAPRAVAGYGFSADVLHAGLYLLPGSTAQLFSARPVTWLAARYDARAPIAVGASLAATGLALLALAHDHSWEVYGALVINGVGVGLAFSSFPGRIVEAVPPEQTGIATGMNAIMRTIGQAIGAAVVTSVLTARLVPGTRLPVEAGYTKSLGAAALLALLAVGLVYLGPAHAPGRGTGTRRAGPGQPPGDEMPVPALVGLTD